MKFIHSLFLFFGFSFSCLAQNQLMINEVSQGPSGVKEYVEFVVAGNLSCEEDENTLDLRGVIFDDNNGYFASGGGTGIASGAVRFTSIPLFQAVPTGTIIVVYNDSDPNPLIPPIDLSLTDGNCRLIIPISSNLLEWQTETPTTSSTSYTASSWTTGGSSWSPLGMANSDDSFQIRSNTLDATPDHSVSWGNNTTNSIIYFTSAGGKVFSFTNDFSNDFNTQVNWTEGTAGTNETPGYANNSANENWILSMNTACRGGELNLNGIVSYTSCPNACDASASAIIQGGTLPLSYSWSTGSSSTSIQDLCIGNYTFVVTDFFNCKDSLSIEVFTGFGSPNATLLDYDSIITLSTNPIQLTYSSSGGIFYSSCGSCISSTGIFSPSIAGSGIHTICYVVGSGECKDTSCIELEVELNEFNLIIPNVLTSNNDGVNDLWFVDYSGIEILNCQILNRWGNLVIEEENGELIWDGKDKNGDEVVEGVYFYKLVFRKNNEIQTMNGFIELIK
jgi:gliding motility-associated-like protein